MTDLKKWILIVLLAFLRFPLFAQEAGAQSAWSAGSYTLSLRANLLRWATLTPDLSVMGHRRERLVDFMDMAGQ